MSARLPQENGDYPLWMLAETKQVLFRFLEDPTLEDARDLLKSIDASLADHDDSSSSQVQAIKPTLGLLDSVVEDLTVALERIEANAMHSTGGAVERIQSAIEKLGGTTNAQP